MVVSQQDGTASGDVAIVDGNQFRHEMGGGIGGKRSQFIGESAASTAGFDGLGDEAAKSLRGSHGSNVLGLNLLRE